MSDLSEYRILAEDPFDLPGEPKTEDQRLKSCLRDGLQLLHHSSHLPASPALLAFWSLTTRNFLICHSSLAGLELGNRFISDLLFRIAFELQLQVMTILDPKSAGIMPGEEFIVDDILNRLCAYTAWSLDSDLRYANMMTKRWRLEKITPLEFSQELLNEYPEISRYLELLYGDADLQSREELGQMRGAIRNNTLDVKKRTMNWLKDRRLSDWRAQIKKRKPRSFFQLIDPEVKSFGRRLEDTALKFADAEYQRGSQYIHGSSIELFLECFEDDQLFLPRLPLGEEDASSGAAHIRRLGHNINVALTNVLRAILASESKNSSSD